MTKRLSAAAAVALAAALTLPTYAQPQSRPQDDPEATVISELVVVATAQGPAWWKATKGASVVWIFGLPPAPTPKGLKWDDRAFQRRLKGAKFLLPPVSEWSGLHDGIQTLPVFPAPLARRVEAAAALLEDPFNDNEYASAASVVLLRGAYYRYNNLRHDVLSEVETAARKARVPILAPPVRRHYWEAWDIDPANPAMVDCIDATLADVVIDPRLYSQSANAWATGDVAGALAAAPKGAGWRCQHLSPGLWDRSTVFITDAIAQALETPGKAVAAVLIPQLVAENGVLQRLRARGYTISDPARALTE